jgi:hypothetical protein
MYIRNAYCNLLPTPEETTRLLPAPASPAPARICFGSPAVGGPAARDHDRAGGTSTVTLALHATRTASGSSPPRGSARPAKYVCCSARTSTHATWAREGEQRQMLGEVWTTQMPPVYVLQSVTASAWRGHMSAPRRRAHVRRCSQRTAWLSQPPARARRRGPAQCHPVEIVWAHSQPGWLRAGMERMSRTPSVSGNERAGAEAARRACREALDAALDRGRASCAEWAGAQWAAEHCMIDRPPRLWQVPGLGWAGPGQLLGLRVRGYARTGSAASSNTTRPLCHPGTCCTYV